MGAVFMLTASVCTANPEFDAVGCDATNVFAANNQIQFDALIKINGMASIATPLNTVSDFRDYLDPNGVPLESFSNTAGLPTLDLCYAPYANAHNYQSILTSAWNESTYTWSIVLQMQPESDINVSVYDCVLKNSSPSWLPMQFLDFAEQTGRFTAPDGQLMFVPGANPTMTVVASPGSAATPGFVAPFIMDARTLPGLKCKPMEGALYTSKALWDEDIVCVLPETGEHNVKGQPTYKLSQGDIITVHVEVPKNNTADIRYGKDNVMLKYVGLAAAPYYTDLSALPCKFE